MIPDHHDSSPSVHQFASTNKTTLIKLISIKLRAAVANGDAVLDLDTRPRHSTKFEAQSKPGMSVHAYLTRVITLTPIPVDAILLSLVYLSRVSSPGSLAEPDKASLFRIKPQEPVQDQICEIGHGRTEPAGGESHQGDDLDHEPEPELGDDSQETLMKICERNQRQIIAKVPINSLTIHRLILSVMVLATKFVSDGYIPRDRTSRVGGVSEPEMDGLEREMLRRLKFELCWKPSELESIAEEIMVKSPVVPAAMTFVAASKPLRAVLPSPSPLPSLGSSSSLSTSSSPTSPPSPSSALFPSPTKSFASQTETDGTVSPRPPQPSTSSDSLISTKPVPRDTALGTENAAAAADAPKPRQQRRMIFVRSQLVGSIYETKYLDYYCQTSRTTRDDPNGSIQTPLNDIPRRNRTSLVVTKLEQNCLKVRHTEIW